MKRRLLLITAMLLVQCGCATHYYRIQSAGLEIFLEMEQASKVELACTTDPFSIYRAKKIGRKLWAVTIPSHREFSYFYLVDGKSYLPDCPLRESDDFGSENCIYQPEM
jgi:hypothetical protein